MNEKCKKIILSIGAGIAGIAAFVLSIIIGERNSSYRKRAREIEGIVDTAGDCNKSAQKGIDEAIGILQKARKRKGKV